MLLLPPNIHLCPNLIDNYLLRDRPATRCTLMTSEDVPYLMYEAVRVVNTESLSTSDLCFHFLPKIFFAIAQRESRCTVQLPTILRPKSLEASVSA